MRKYKIIRHSPFAFKNKIIEFWEEYLPDTPAERIEWMDANPEGSAIWFFAIDEKSDKLVGTISIMPRVLTYNKTRIKTGILGDLMIHSEHRLFGPVFDLLKEAIKTVDLGEFDIIYTIPNKAARNICKRVGMHPNLKVIQLVKPQRLETFVEKYISTYWARIIGKPAAMLMNLLSRETFIKDDGFIEQIDLQNVNYIADDYKMMAKNTEKISKNIDQALIKWRYLENPTHGFTLYAYRSNADKLVKGLFVIKLVNNNLELYDIITNDEKVIYAIIKNLKSLAKAMKMRGIYFSVDESCHLVKQFKRCNYFDTKDTADVYIYPNRPVWISDWCFTSADRNI
jgi:hypothetical protein